MTSINRWHASIGDAVQVPNEEGRMSSLIFKDKDMQVRYYSPNSKDTQMPHQQDEVYVIAKGSGTFVKGDEKISFSIGDIIFVPKNENHYFKNFTNDFSTWVIFYGT
tara:strand:- start:398 stop:718 length:321 start_codon:yes stop_codon:yes gene_type:complete